MTICGKYIALAALTISLVMLSLAGACATSVPEREYNALKSEVQAARAELETLKSKSAGNARIAVYAEINDMCVDVWRVLAGNQSKYGYGKNDSGKWATDMQTKIASLDEAELTTLWKSFMAATPGTDQSKKGFILMSYVSDRLKTLTMK